MRITLYMVLVIFVVFAAACPGIEKNEDWGYYPGYDFKADYPGFRKCGDAGEAGPCGDAGPAVDSSKPDILAPDMCVPTTPAKCKVIFTFPHGNETTVHLRGDLPIGWDPGQKMIKVTAGGKTSWELELEASHGADLEYKFYLDSKTWKNDPCNTKTRGQYNNSYVKVVCPDSCSGNTKMAVCSTNYFDWRGAVMYFVMLDRFNNGDTSNDKPQPGNVKTASNWQGGDLAGLLAKIQGGYFSDLGVNVIWITSPLDNPDEGYVGQDVVNCRPKENYSGYHGYWPKDLTKVENHLGTEKLLKQVVDEAHKKKIRVVLDYVMNHVHTSAPVYKQNPGWFWSVNLSGSQCICGKSGCGWDGPNKRRCWFEPYLADFNFNVAAARSYSVQNALSWIKKLGIDGFRLDAIKHIEMSWLTEMRKEVDKLSSGQKFYLVGETFDYSAANLMPYIGADKLDGQFDFPLREALVRLVLMRKDKLGDLDGTLSSLQAIYKGAIMGTFLGNHDLPRAIHLAEDTPRFTSKDSGWCKGWTGLPAKPTSDKPYQRLAVAYTALMTQPGIPLIYYGDEIGLPGGGDPDNRRMMPWSGHATYQTALKQHIAKLAKFRQQHRALSHGTRQALIKQPDVYGYSMTQGSDQVVVLLNRADSAATINVKLPKSSYTDALTGKTFSASQITLSPRSSVVLY